MAYDIFGFAHEVRMVGDLEGPGQMTLQAVVTSDSSYGGRAKTRRLCHGSCAPKRLSSWELIDRGRTTASFCLVVMTGLRPRPGWS